MALVDLVCLTLGLCFQLQHCAICLCSGCFSHDQVCFNLVDTLFQLPVVLNAKSLQPLVLLHGRLLQPLVLLHGRLLQRS